MEITSLLGCIVRLKYFPAYLGWAVGIGGSATDTNTTNLRI